jgi:hypothetical protein
MPAAEYPSANNTPANAPALVPEIISGMSLRSSSILNTPICAKPLEPPPLSANPNLYFGKLSFIASIIKTLQSGAQRCTFFFN